MNLAELNGQSQAHLYTYDSTALAIPTQLYADLLKASWILIDIISKHPQQRFWSPTGEYLQVQLLAEVRHCRISTKFLLHGILTNILSKLLEMCQVG